VVVNVDLDDRPDGPHTRAARARLLHALEHASKASTFDCGQADAHAAGVAQAAFGIGARKEERPTTRGFTRSTATNATPSGKPSRQSGVSGGRIQATGRGSGRTLLRSADRLGFAALERRPRATIPRERGFPGIGSSTASRQTRKRRPIRRAGAPGEEESSASTVGSLSASGGAFRRCHRGESLDSGRARDGDRRHMSRAIGTPLTRPIPQSRDSASP
jgi:hypothetical protein